MRTIFVLSHKAQIEVHVLNVALPAMRVAEELPSLRLELAGSF
jgi:hypothetical protein